MHAAPVTRIIFSIILRPTCVRSLTRSLAARFRSLALLPRYPFPRFHPPLLLQADLGVIETTNGLQNRELLKLITPKGGLMSWMRVMVANYLAVDGRSWTETFATENGGTYNNQWFVVDMKKFEPHKPLKPGTLWVLEQIPGYVHSADQTKFLTTMGYWPSYNAPFYKDIANKSGMEGAWETAPRHFLFKRNATMVHDLTSFGDLMRYNNFEHDPLSHGTPNDAIMARGDLGKGGGSAGGGIDSKISSFKMASGGKRACLAMNGPTHAQLPPFSWSSFKGKKPPPHFGQPDTFDYKYEHMSPSTMTWLGAAAAALPSTDDEALANAYVHTAEA